MVKVAILLQTDSLHSAADMVAVPRPGNVLGFGGKNLKFYYVGIEADRAAFKEYCINDFAKRRDYNMFISSREISVLHDLIPEADGYDIIAISNCVNVLTGEKAEIKNIDKHMRFISEAVSASSRADILRLANYADAIVGDELYIQIRAHGRGLKYQEIHWVRGLRDASPNFVFYHSLLDTCKSLVVLQAYSYDKDNVSNVLVQANGFNTKSHAVSCDKYLDAVKDVDILKISKNVRCEDLLEKYKKLNEKRYEDTKKTLRTVQKELGADIRFTSTEEEMVALKLKLSQAVSDAESLRQQVQKMQDTHKEEKLKWTTECSKQYADTLAQRSAAKGEQRIAEMDVMNKQRELQQLNVSIESAKKEHATLLEESNKVVKLKNRAVRLVAEMKRVLESTQEYDARLTQELAKLLQGE